MGPVCIRHCSYHFATQSSHFVNRAVWQAKMASIDFWILGECKALWGELERVSASSLLHWRWSLNPGLSRSCAAAVTDTRMRILRIGATQPDGSRAVSHVHVHVHGSLTKHAWTLVLVGRHVKPRASWERQETRSDWMSCTLLKITGPYYCIVHRDEYECSHQCGPCANVHVQASWVFSWSWSRSSPRLKRNPIRPDVMYFLLAGDKRALHRYARNRRGSVALYCALVVCALCAARCGACDRRGLARKKYRAGEKAPAQR